MDLPSLQIANASLVFLALVAGHVPPAPMDIIALTLPRKLNAQTFQTRKVVLPLLLNVFAMQGTYENMTPACLVVQINIAPINSL